MERRRLGRTGHLSSVVTFGAAGIGHVSQEVADRAIETALRYGVNHFDVAPSYGEAELRLGPWMERIRPQIFLGCKTQQRTRAAAREELLRSLERLRVDSLDLYQLHAVGTIEELDRCTAPGGALEALIAAREEGLVRWLGITGHGHQAPATHLEALRRFDFDTVMFPLNFILYARPDYRRDYEALLAECQRRDVGIHILKSVAREPWGDQPRTHTTWYRPFTDPDDVRRAVHFVLDQPITTLCSAGDVTVLPLVLEAAEHYRPMPEAERRELVAAASRYATIF